AYDKAGNLIQSANQRSGVLNYVYDKIGRIQEARNSQTDRSETFTFDPAHNILSDKAAEGKGGNPVSGNRLKEYNGIEYT
ncbi:type IV secretion protein Rhs, partial [Neisseria sp. P0014.S004]